MLKVQNGTRKEEPALCRRCQRGQVMRGAADSKEVIHCCYLGRRITFDVVQCSNFEDRGNPSIADMYHTAWILETSKNSRTIGFLPYREWRAKHPDEGGPNCPPGF